MNGEVNQTWKRDDRVKVFSKVSEDVALAMSGQKDYYQLLGLGPGASEDEIKKAYRWQHRSPVRKKH